MVDNKLRGSIENDATRVIPGKHFSIMCRQEVNALKSLLQKLGFALQYDSTKEFTSSINDAFSDQDLDAIFKLLNDLEDRIEERGDL